MRQKSNEIKYSYHDFPNISTALASSTDNNNSTAFIVYLEESSDGIAEIRQIQQFKNFIFAPIVIIRAHEKPELSSEYKRHGVQSVLVKKDFSPEVLMDTLNKIDQKIQVWGALTKQRKKKTDQLAIVSHDLKGPLTIINSYMDILLDESLYTLSPGVKEKLERTKYNAQTAYDIVTDLLDGFRNKKSWKMQFSRVSVRSIIDECIQNFSLRAEEKKIEFIVNDAIVDYSDIYADQKSMIQLFTNILDNALKFSPQGGSIKINIQKRNSELKYQDRSKQAVSIVISDEGPGIPEEKMDIIFNSYQQARKSDAYIGTGLGLSICRRICNLHKGHIWATKNVTGGTSMRVILPSFKSKTEAIQVRTHSDILKTKQSNLYTIKEQKTILIIDDSSDVHEITTKALSELGFEVISVHNGREALQWLTDFDPDLILLDLNMPVLAGNEFINYYKLFDKPTCPIFIFSTYMFESSFSKSLSQTDGFIQKPINIEEFVTKTKIHFDWEYLSKKFIDKKSIKLKEKEEHELSGVKVLLVDDCSDNFIILKHRFSKLNCQLDYASSGKEAVKKVFSEDYEIVLMDLMMDGMSGNETMNLLKELAELNNFKLPSVYAFSVDHNQNNKSELQESGFSGSILKPASQEQINKLILEHRVLTSIQGKSTNPRI